MSNMKLALLLVVSATLGAAIMWLFQGHSLKVVPESMTYSDFVAVLLTAISTLVAVIGLAIAIFAIWGWAQFRKGVEAKITEITPTFLSKELQDGGARQLLDNLVVDFFRAELAKPGAAEAWASERDRRRGDLADLDDAPLEE